MLANYLPVLIFLTVATGLALVLMGLGRSSAVARQGTRRCAKTVSL